MAQKKVYDKEFKIQAVKLGREIGFSAAAKELGINVDTLYGWNKRAKDARLDLGPGTQTPDTAMSLAEEVQKLRQQNREQAKEIARLKEENEFLAEASAFFAASRRKSAKNQECSLLIGRPKAARCAPCIQTRILLVSKTSGRSMEIGRYRRKNAWYCGRG